ncbi:MAG: HNH endonuclease [Firmicutes bacterium]|nr:HNH endonuclease [Bacillota bacterium]
MTFSPSGRDYAVVNMSVSPGAPYADKWEDDGRTIIYEGHDAKRDKYTPEPKLISQPTGIMCENGKFIKAVERYKSGSAPRVVKVYEKIKPGIWVYNGFFNLTDYWQENDIGNPARKVCKFKLEAIDEKIENIQSENVIIEHARLIPSAIKFEVYTRDKGCCRECGAAENLHYDHILPYSKGGTSVDAKNIQILCATCNLKKGAKII